MSKKYDHSLNDENYHKYKDLVETFSDFFADCFKINKNKDLRNAVAMFAEKVFERGCKNKENKIIWN
jgi:hypothetical protein